MNPIRRFLLWLLRWLERIDRFLDRKLFELRTRPRADPYEVGNILTFESVADALLDGDSFDDLWAVPVANRPSNLDGMNLCEFTRVANPKKLSTWKVGNALFADPVGWAGSRRNNQRIAGAVIYDRSKRNKPVRFFISAGDPSRWVTRRFSFRLVFHPNGLLTVTV